MSRIRGRDTRPELVLRDALAAVGLHSDRGARAPAGRPDFVFIEARVAVFVDGCQWHGCPDHYVRPRTREDFWGRKLAENVERDGRQAEELRAEGWRVVRVWEHEIPDDIDVAVRRVKDAVAGEPDPRDIDYRVARVEVIDASIDLERRHLVDVTGRGPAVQQQRRRWTGKRGRPPSSTQ